LQCQIRFDKRSTLFEDQELVDQLFLGIEYGYFQHVAMRQARAPGTPLAVQGQITELRPAQIVAVVTLTALGRPETNLPWMTTNYAGKDR
jgi:hypothetical protein